MKGIGREDALSQGKAFLICLPLFSSTLGVASLHLRDDLLIGVCGRRGFLWRGNSGKEAPLDNRKNLIPLDRFAELVFTCCEVVYCLKQIHIFKRLALAGLQ